MRAFESHMKPKGFEVITAEEACNGFKFKTIDTEGMLRKGKVDVRKFTKEVKGFFTKFNGAGRTARKLSAIIKTQHSLDTIVTVCGL